jgi:hypothetical protein
MLDKIWDNLKEFCERLFGYPRPIRIPIPSSHDRKSRFKN